MISVVGILVILALAVALSTDRRKIDLRIVISAFALQTGIAVVVLYVPPGRTFILLLSDSVRAILDFAAAGIDMVFGSLTKAAGDEISFAIHVLPVIIFFLSLMSVLYHLGVMQIVVRAVGGAIRRVIGTRTVESLNAAASIFVGLSGAFAVRPYLGKLTDAQIFTVMVSGLATIDGTVLFAYAQMGIRIEYLLAATFMALPGGLLMAKLMMPDEEPRTRERETLPPAADDGHRHANVILAAANGASDGVRLAVNIGAMLLAFVSLIALLNGIVGGLGSLAGIDGLSVEKIFGTVFAPLMYLLGVPWQEASIAGALFGEKVILNEFVAYLHMTNVQEAMSPRTEAIVTFALCGFANPTSIAILLGGLGSLVPAKRDLIARYGLRAVAAGSLSNLMSAALASLLVGF